MGAHTKSVVNGYTKKRGQTRLAGSPSKRCGFVKQLLLGDQNLFGGDGSLS
jgi:hypothetical protein